MFSKIFGLCRVIVLKIIYNKKLIIKSSKNFNSFRSINNIKISKGTINIKGKINIWKNSRLSAQDGGNIIVGSDCFINTNCIIASRGNIEIGNNVKFGPNCCVYDHDHCFNENGLKEGYNNGKVKIGNNVWIGAGSIILRNTEIGDNCIIGAGCVVSGKIPNNSLVKSDRNLSITKLVNKE